jgi:hypothetical protein
MDRPDCDDTGDDDLLAMVAHFRTQFDPEDDGRPSAAARQLAAWYREIRDSGDDERLRRAMRECFLGFRLPLVIAAAMAFRQVLEEYPGGPEQLGGTERRLARELDLAFVQGDPVRLRAAMTTAMLRLPIGWVRRTAAVLLDIPEDED